MKQRPVCEIGNEGRAKGRKKVKKKKKKKKGEKKSEPDDNRLVKAGWNVYQSVDLSMRVVPQKNMEIYFPPAFRYIRENGKRHGVCRTFVTRLFFYLCFFDAWIYRGRGGGGRSPLPEPVIWDASAGPPPLSIWFFFLSSARMRIRL